MINEAYTAQAMSRSTASAEAAAATVWTSSITQPMMLEAADAPTSMCAHMAVGESIVTVAEGLVDGR